MTSPRSVVAPIRVQPPTARETTESTLSNPGVSPTQSKPITSRSTVGDAASGPASSVSKTPSAARDIARPDRPLTSRSADEKNSASARTPRADSLQARNGFADLVSTVGLAPRENNTQKNVPDRSPASKLAGAESRVLKTRQDTDAARTRREDAAVTKDLDAVAARPGPTPRTGPDEKDVAAQRAPIARQRGDDLAGRTRDLNDGGAVRVDPRAKPDAALPRERDTDRSLNIRKTETNTRVDNSTVYTDNSVHISGNNNVYINGSVNGWYPTPYRADRHHTFILHDHWRHYHHDHWLDRGGYFELNWARYSCGRVVSFYWAPYHSYCVSYYYPGYHRKYVFFSIGGYWPTYYRYRRYYWYGCHPYRWYGSYIIEQPYVEPVVQNVYNITYETPVSSGPANYDYYFDAATEDFSDVRARLQQQQQAAGPIDDSPMAETSVDVCFDQAVRLFAQGKYEQAVFKLRVAMILEPEDVVLPFAYCQALFAAGDYDGAAAALRATLANRPQDQTPEAEQPETVYYPRGLYEDEKVLQSQINALAEAARKSPDNADYQLLLGYQLLGSGRVDEAITPLHKALEMSIQTAPAMTLIRLLEQIKADQAAAEAAAQAAAAAPAAVTAPATTVAPAAPTASVAPAAPLAPAAPVAPAAPAAPAQDLTQVQPAVVEPAKKEQQ
ncbi:MAG TPA: tetratricopeptide repeat protein [Anaerohalosphaeraceae bacterium]|nr:tetratricopeptide repeat protein [Anaerohalosphaeraceae bacterium]HRT51646.1 tetratricopeptide repeat protein [Anaerohalosphaeraceae bacterium]HRT87689.1 tetratricopeptide repeat protein [Anaerohalosphaeraceae bacterium]